MSSLLRPAAGESAGLDWTGVCALRVIRSRALDSPTVLPAKDDDGGEGGDPDGAAGAAGSAGAWGADPGTKIF